MEGPVTVFILMALVGTVMGADGDGVLTGYLMTSADNCLDATGTATATLGDTMEATLNAACKLVYLVETATTDEYYILDAATQTDSLQLADSTAPSFSANDLAVQFSDGDNLLTTPTAASSAGITDSSNPFLIQLAGATAADEACLTLTPEYLAAACSDAAWYFIEAECQVADCTTCNVDALKCDSCTDTSHVFSTDKSTCEACATAFGADCSACSDTSGSGVCTTCGNSKVVAEDETSCVTCTVTDCDTCSADEVCATCTGDLLLNGNACEACATHITECLTCDSTTTCLTCDNGKAVSSDGSACVSCTVASCDSCSADDVCAECSGDLVPNNDSSACVACDTAIADCTSCNVTNGMTTCETCATNMTVSSDATLCVTCDVTDCETCSEDDVCDTCTGSLVLSGNACTEAETTTSGSESSLHRTSCITVVALAWKLLFTII